MLSSRSRASMTTLVALTAQVTACVSNMTQPAPGVTVAAVVSEIL